MALVLMASILVYQYIKDRRAKGKAKREAHNEARFAELVRTNDAEKNADHDDALANISIHPSDDDPGEDERLSGKTEWQADALQDEGQKYGELQEEEDHRDDSAERDERKDSGEVLGFAKGDANGGIVEDEVNGRKGRSRKRAGGFPDFSLRRRKKMVSKGQVIR